MRWMAWMLPALLSGPAAAAAAAPDGGSLVPPQIVLMEGAGRQLAFIAEKSPQKFHVYEWADGRVRLVETLPCTTGKADGDKRVEGDLKTPEGAYRFLRYIDGRQLPPLYGAGAFVMDYPNPFDRHDRKTGSGIWMHGVETDDRVHVARDTRGCVALANPDVERLRPMIRLHDTPLIVVETLTGADPGRVAGEAAAMRAFVERWRRSWESKDIDAYMRSYGSGFFANGRDRTAWERHKRELARSEGERRIGLDELVVLREKDRWWVSFRQEYATSSHRDVGRKTLFVLGGGPDDWTIIGEQWRALDGAMRLIDPPPLSGRPMSPELVAAIAPDAAAQAPPARPLRDPPPSRPASVATEPPSDPPASDAPASVSDAPAPDQDGRPPVGPEVTASFEASRPAAAAAAGTEPATPAPAASAPAAPAPAAPAPAASATAASVPGASGTAASLPGVPAATAAAPAPSARRAALDARLEPPVTTRRTYEFFAPHVQRQGEALLVQVQMLSQRPTSVRSGALVIGIGDEPPQVEPFEVRQGRLIALSLPDAALPARIGLVVRDEAGNVALEQALIIEELP